MVISKPIEVFTIEELRDTLNALVDKGLGDKIILLPVLHADEYEADYVFADKRNSFSLEDINHKVAYMEALSPDDDADAANKLGL